MSCENCQLRCKNKGLKKDESPKAPVPKWCPHPEIRYPDDRQKSSGGGINNYESFKG